MSVPVVKNYIYILMKKQTQFIWLFILAIHPFLSLSRGLFSMLTQCIKRQVQLHNLSNTKCWYFHHGRLDTYAFIFSTIKIKVLKIINSICM